MFTLTTADEQTIRDPSPDQISEVIEGLPAEHVVLAFRSYQRGEADWKTAFTWERVEL